MIVDAKVDQVVEWYVGKVDSSARRISQRKLVLATAVALLMGWLPISVSACTLCIGFPEKTDVDYLLEADCIVLARQSPEDVFTFQPHETLKGRWDGVEIDLLVDSKTRRILRTNEDRCVILVQDRQGGSWRSLGIVSESYVSVARRVVLLLSDSVRKSADARQRWEFFLPLFGHRDPRIRELAYLELGRAPYSVIKQVGQAASREDWMPMLSDPMYLEWRSLAILLLAQSENPQDKQRVLDAFRSAHRFGLTTNLAAWAAGAIEVDAEATIRFIEDEYLCKASRSEKEIEAVIAALSMHGSQQDSERQDRIVAGYRLLLEYHPPFAPQVADDLYDWGRSELIEELAAIERGETEFVSAGRKSIQRYLHASASLKEPDLARE